MKDVARKACVSTATVSSVLNNSAFVSDDLKKRVEDTIQELGYRIDAVARSLKNRKTHTVGLLISNISNPFYTDIVRGVEDYLIKHGYNYVLCNTDYDLKKERMYLNVFLERRVDGIILTTLSPSNESLVEEIKKSGVPIVFLDYVPVKKMDGVHVLVVDNEEGSYNATKHLLEHGYREVGFLGFPEWFYTYKTRFSGYKKALEEFGLKVNNDFIISSKASTSKAAYKAFNKFLNKKIKLRAVFAANNQMLLGAFRALKDNNILIPQDVALIGFDDFENSTLIEPSISVVAQPTFILGNTAAEILINKINKKTQEQDNPQEKVIVLKTELIIRKSCGC